MEGGIDKGLGGEGLLDNRWSQALATCRRDSLFVSHKRRASTLQCKLAKGRSGNGGPAASPMIKSVNIWRGGRRRK